MDSPRSAMTTCGSRLDDPHAGVREHAVRLAEPRLAASRSLLERVLAMANDPDIRVRSQAALSLGGLADDGPTRAIASIAGRDPGDPWIRLAVLTGRPDRAVDLVEALARRGVVPSQTLRALAAIVGTRNQDQEIRRALEGRLTRRRIGHFEPGASWPSG